MRYTRRDFGKLALTAIPAASILRPSLTALAQATPNSTINWVDLGSITYSYRAMPAQGADAGRKYGLESGISGVELMGNSIETYAGAPAMASTPTRWPVSGRYSR